MQSIKKFLFKNEAVEGINSPNDYLYIKVLSYNLAVLNSWPFKEIGMRESLLFSKCLRYFHLIIIFTAWAGCISYLAVHNHHLTFFEKGQNFITILMNSVMAIRVTTLTFSAKYRDLTKDYVIKNHLFYYKDRSEYSMKIHKRVHLISHLFTLGLTTQMTIGIILYNVIPMYNNYSAGKFGPDGLGNSTYEHSLYYLHPFNYLTDFKGYVTACILHWILSYICSTWFCIVDLLLSLMVFNIWGHLKILLHKLNTFPKPTQKSSLNLEGAILNVDMYSESEQENILKLLIECIDYHREIIGFTDRMSDVFGATLFVYYMFHQATGCLLLLECSQMTAPALMRYLPLTIILFQQLIQLSVIFELIGSTSDKLKDGLYSVPWECMNTKNRKVLFIFLINVQESIHVKALGIANVGVTSMATILKTSLSYFTFLRSM